jgi:hypothetical protein
VNKQKGGPTRGTNHHHGPCEPSLRSFRTGLRRGGAKIPEIRKHPPETGPQNRPENRRTRAFCLVFFSQIGLIDASLIGAAAVSLSIAYAIGDVLSIRHSLHRKVRDAKGFYAVYSFFTFFLMGALP